MVAVINETMAWRFFQDPQPLGKHFHIMPSSGEGQIYEVIGVVADTKYESVDEETLPIAYLPLRQESDVWANTRFQIRTAGLPNALVPMVTSAIADLNPTISVEYTTLADDVAISLARPRVLAILAGFFGAVALLLATIGLYGTLSYRVTSRRNEIGVRLALGAKRTQVVTMVLSEVGRLTVVGIVVGAGVTLASTRVLDAFLFGVTATDPMTLVLSAVALAVVALAAGALPAWRAARLDPMVALREE
jgi:ABC-type antimicrobial peptide transport system permease subunit